MVNVLYKIYEALRVIAYNTQVATEIFAEIFLYDNSTADTIPTGTTYTKLLRWSANGQNANCIPDYSNGKITATQPGKYEVIVELSGHFSKSITVESAIHLDEVIQNNIKKKHCIKNVNECYTVTLSGFIDVTSENQDIDIRLRHDDGSSVNVTVIDANLTAKYIGRT
jgi:hypothetical protein